MNILKNKSRQTQVLGIMCCVIYFISYVTRIDFGAIISEIIEAKGILKSEAGIVTTFNFIAYGVGQLISGAAADRHNPKKLIFYALLVTAVCNILMPFVNGIILMTAVWFVNGIAQAFMWPPLVKIMSTYFDDINYIKTSVNVSAACSLATLSVYFFAPFVIRAYDWTKVFFIAALMAIIGSIVWLVVLKKINVCTEVISNEKIESKENKEDTRLKFDKKAFIASGLIFIGLAISVQGVLREGITLWMPSYISEVFNIPTTSAILSTVLLPLISIFFTKLTGLIFRKLIKDEMKCATFIYSLSFLSIIPILLAMGKSVGVSVIFAALTMGCMHGVNSILTTMIPRQFMKYGNVATMSGVLNSFTYIGSSLASWGCAKISENFGWGMTLGSWLLFALLGTLITLSQIKKWERFKKL